MFTINNQKINTLEDVKGLPNEDLYQKNIFDFLTDWFGNSKSIKTKTSGSTGKPKLISLKKSAMLKSAELTCSFFQLKENETALLCLPTNFIAGKMMLVRSYYAELKLISVQPTRNPLKEIDQSIDFAAMTPMQVSTILKENPKKLDLIKTLIIGGAPVEKALENRLQNFKTKCFSTFGMTETITHIALKELNKSVYFDALPSIYFSETNENSLVINAPYISKEKIVTNDKIQLISPTSFLWKGRTDNIINSGGLKIQAEELEGKIALLLPQNRFYVSTVPDELLGEKIILIIEANKNFDLTKIDFKNIEKYSVPKNIYTLDKFLETETGKILRKDNKALLGLN